MNIAEALCVNCGYRAEHHRVKDMACPDDERVGVDWLGTAWAAPPGTTATSVRPSEVSVTLVRRDPFLEPVLPTDSEERKNIPLFSGFLNYFPLACAAVARLSKRGNDKHNPGQPLHWSRDKSTDHEDCILRHLVDVNTLDAKTGEYEDAVALAWRALAKLQILEEKRLGKPMSLASK